MYETDDPRSRLASAGGGAGPASAFGDSTYARFYEEAPREQDSTQRTWYVRQADSSSILATCGL